MNVSRHIGLLYCVVSGNTWVSVYVFNYQKRCDETLSTIVPMAADAHSSCQLVVGPPPIFELRRSPPQGGYQGYGIDVNWYFNEVIHGPMEWLF